MTAQAARPTAWTLDGLPHHVLAASRAASIASGSGGAVAFQSKYRVLAATATLRALQCSRWLRAGDTLRDPEVERRPAKL